ncbi:hypothetical protein EB796_018105 [Bugula neritina]|uniref:Uncharacterized protein n=1 Tax=Bugula neritina TaxID=10212 RepID=A0A7J7JDY4_BUGNE|nr:hypothetical protein EB796_018105 [Bugula neritina]
MSDQLKGIKGLIASLVLNIIQNRDFLFQDLISEVTIFSSETVVESLNQIYKIKADVLKRDGHRFTDPQQLNEFTDRYTACVKFFVEDFDCFLLHDKTTVMEKLLDSCLSAEELSCTVTVYDYLIHDLEGKPQDVNFLAKEQHNLWSAANSLLGKLQASYPEDKAKETMEAITAYKCWFRHSGMDPVVGKISEKETDTYSKEEILRTMGQHIITDLKVEGDIPSAITEIAPKVTNLCVRSLTNPNNLEVLPQLTHLRSLDLSKNDLGPFPECISKMTSLKHLCLAGCNLSRLPNSLSRLHDLQTLNVSHNSFDKGMLPAVILKMSSLIELHLVNCQLCLLPKRYKMIIFM